MLYDKKYAAGLWRGISLNHDELIEILEEFKAPQVQNVDDGVDAYDCVITGSTVTVFSKHVLHSVRGRPSSTELRCP